MTPSTGGVDRSEGPSVDALLGRFPVLRPPVSTAGAAVTIVLRDVGSGPEVLLIERAVNPADPASGDVALPGGRVEEPDGSLLATALRELREEVGLSPNDLAGPLRFVVATPARRFGVQVGVFAGRLAPAAGPPTARSPGEVAHVFWLPTARLAVSRLIARPTERGELQFLATVHDGHVVWGFTRRVLREFLGLPREASSER